MDEIFETYKCLGFYLFPIAKGTKVPPKGFEWRKLSSKNPLDWVRWNSEYPGCNWAVDCDKSGLCVIDIDPRNGGDITWEDLKLDFPEDVPETYQIKTPSGGFHLYFTGSIPGGPAWQGIDIKSLGGYVLCPPSLGYSVIFEWDICPLPDWLRPKKEEEKEKPSVDLSSVKEGKRDESLFKLGASLRAKNVQPEAIRQALVATNKTFQPPLTEKEVEAKFKQAMKYEAGSNLPKGSKAALWEKLSLSLTSGNQPIPNVANVVKVLEGVSELKESIWYDEFQHRIFTTWNVKEKREWKDIDDLVLLQYLQDQIGISRLSKQAAQDGLGLFAWQNRINEFKEWVSALKWDGIERIELFLENYFGCEPTDYCRAVSKNFWIGMVTRGLRPGTQLDTMVIFEGAQGTLKSSALRAIGGKWFSEVHHTITEKDFPLIFDGKLLLEFGEFNSFRRAEINAIKGIITNRVDRLRSPYGKRFEDHPRTCTFTATTNDEVYLGDITGGRRFLPIKIGIRCPIDPKGIEKDRALFFAEAYSMTMKNEPFWIVPEQAKIEQEDRRIVDEFEQLIASGIKIDHRSQFTLTEIGEEILKLNIKDLNQPMQKRIAQCLRAIKMKRYKSDGKHYWITSEHSAYKSAR